MTQHNKAQSRAPVFIVGCGRSGTTLLLRIIHNYTQMAGCRDYGLILRFKRLLPYYGTLERRENRLRLIKDILGSYDYRHKFQGPDLDPEHLCDELPIATYRDLVESIMHHKAKACGKQYWADKTPYYAYYIPEIMELFPEARVVHIIRDGRDMALSVFRQSWGPKNAYMAAVRWRRFLDHVDRPRSLLQADQFYQLRYEDLLTAPVETFGRLMSFLQFPASTTEIWARECENYLQRDNHAKWRTKMSHQDCTIFESVAGGYLETHGYPTLLPAHQRRRMSWTARCRFWTQDWVRRLQAGESFARGARKRLQTAKIRLRHMVFQ